MKSNRIALLFLILILVLVTGCGGKGGSKGPTLASISITPTTPSLALGVPQLFTATGVYSDNSTRDLTTTAIWSSSSEAVATINKGLATTLSTGTTTISASLSNITDSTTLTVTAAKLASITVTPADATISTGATLSYTALGTYTDSISPTDITASVTWSSSAPGVATISSAGLATAPTSSITTAPTSTTMIVAASNGVSGSAILTVTGGSAAVAMNVLPITVNGSLCSSANSVNYLNKPCVSVTICVPNTSTCQTITDILLDTGSFGLRIFKQALTITLPQITTSGSGSLAECVQFGDGSAEWGPVKSAAVLLGSEPAVTVPIQVIDATFGAVPSSCGVPDKQPTDAGFNGILGVGLFAQDCGSVCQTNAVGLYYSCSGTNCTGTTVPLSNQVINPVASLPRDSNGVIVQLPSVPTDGYPSINGILVLGIGTQSNNTPLPGVKTYNANTSGEVRTIFNGTTYFSIIDSGSNGLFFTPPSASLLPACGGWFCPSSTTLFSATNEGATGTTSGDVVFQIGNFMSLISGSNQVFSDIGGTGPGIFDWGLPFYFGRSIYVGIRGQMSSLGTGPYFAY